MLPILEGRVSGRLLAASLFLSGLVPIPVALAAPIAPATAVDSSTKNTAVIVVRGGFGWGNRNWIHRERRTNTSKSSRRRHQ
ncbi:hypothetical protein U8607_13355 [Methylobacterium durans]|uniref:hypothetical protein n=1 Tax=Methylobacterium durans TaxID=2202825 RepID=UPI002AFF9537|nr:hypothetical protein [Methylobacterium durans]MEA1833069.1 hypothetical protein [Methylobacterium durans]